MSQRTERIDELLRQEIGQALERELADPRIGFVTVTDVETSPDLAHARVWVSVIGTEERRKEALAALRRAMPYVRRGLGSKIRMRRIPELEVRLDESAERGTRIMRLIDELEAGHEPDESKEQPDPLPMPVPRLPRAGDAPRDPEAEAPAPRPAKPRRHKRSAGGTGRSRPPHGKGGL